MTNIRLDRLAQIISARLNHDYISPITAISNGIDIYSIDKENGDEGIEIVKEGLKIAIAELQYNRIAFGSYGEDEEISSNEVQNRITDFFQRDKIKIDFENIPDPIFKKDAKMWMLTALCFRSSFVALRRLSIIYDKRGWKLQATGDGMIDREGNFRGEDDWLQIAEPAQTTVQFPLLFLLLDRLNYDFIRQRTEEDQLTVNLWSRDI